MFTKFTDKNQLIVASQILKVNFPLACVIVNRSISSMLRVFGCGQNGRRTLTMTLNIQ